MTSSKTTPVVEWPTNDGLRPKSFRAWLMMILAAAALLRVGIIAYADARPALFDFPDSHRYLLVARNIAAGKGPIESADVRAGTDPLYPMLLSVGVGLGRQSTPELMQFGRIINGLASIAAVVLLAGLARNIAGGRTALIAAALLAFDPILLFFNALVLTETCYVALLLAGFFAIARVASSRSAAWAMLGGACIGLATLLRSTNLLMPVFLAPFVWGFAGRRTHIARAGRIRALACFMLAAAAVLTPTVMRNYRLFGRFVPVRTGSGAGLMEALGPQADGGPGMDRIAYPEFPSGADEHERDRACRDAAFRWTRANPGIAARLAWTKLLRTWSVTLNASDYSSPFYTAVCWLTVAPIYALALGGVWRWRKRRLEVALLLTPAVYFTLIHMVFVGSVRYRLPAMPFLFVLAAVPLSNLLRNSASVRRN